MPLPTSLSDASLSTVLCSVGSNTGTLTSSPNDIYFPPHAPSLPRVQTAEYLSDLLEGLHDIHRVQDEEQEQEHIHDPPALNPKGRPRTARITSAIEGPPRGGGVHAGDGHFALRGAPKRSYKQAELDMNVQSDDDANEPPASKHWKKVFKCSICR
ncbi:hypothetical protein BDP27DRAFT_1440682 [Rhodocollybia butyracea]|uniref:Uncharacterized protein n=1 Tax=Rhodocollybia butyracea TaxID=206335 RepID=A0A9P5P5H3_9AGAR|nr:hypothetical protein BDP27DRAFT_1440682 [Rhodocollybia butyracea]